ncbi:MAG: TonB family protein [Pseudomonadota bacterium]|nr:TonB family protein [Pseudomonadota bacterium]
MAHDTTPDRGTSAGRTSGGKNAGRHPAARRPRIVLPEFLFRSIVPSPFLRRKGRQVLVVAAVSVLVHLVLLVLAWGLFAWLRSPSLPDSPSEIPVEIVAVQDQTTEENAAAEPATPVRRQSGPDDEGMDAPKEISPVPSRDEQQTAPQQQRVAPARPQDPAPAQTPAPQAQPRSVPAPRPLAIPIPVPSPGTQALNQAMSTVFGPARSTPYTRAGQGLGDRWLNAVRARIGPVDSLLSWRNDVRLPASYQILVDRTGKVLSVSVLVSCGNPGRDIMVMNQVRAASPLPLPPPGLPVPVRVTLEIAPP